MIPTFDGLRLTLKQYYDGPEGSNTNKKETANKKKKRKRNKKTNKTNKLERRK